MKLSLFRLGVLITACLVKLKGFSRAGGMELSEAKQTNADAAISSVEQKVEMQIFHCQLATEELTEENRTS